jgi:acyl-CoA hydrolase
MEAGFKVIAEDKRTRSMRHVSSCFFSMVAVGDDCKPVAVHPLRPSTPEEIRSFEQAALRKKPAQ